MANFSIYSPFLESWEGGYSNDKDDKGGKTYRGVTIATWDSYCKQHGITGPAAQLKCMNRKQWTEIMKGGYWDKCWCDLIKSQGIANMVADWAVNAGVKNALRNIQQAISKGLKVDGIMGPSTLNAINSENPAVMFFLIRNARLAYYTNLTKANRKQLRFLNGWQNRTKSLKLHSFILNDLKKTEVTFNAI